MICKTVWRLAMIERITGSTIAMIEPTIDRIAVTIGLETGMIASITVRTAKTTGTTTVRKGATTGKSDTTTFTIDTKIGITAVGAITAIGGATCGKTIRH